MAQSSPALSLADLKRREPGERLLLPRLVVVGYNHREIKYQGIEQTVHDYRFSVDGEAGLWEVEYSGQHHFRWKPSVILYLVATIHRHSKRFRCTRIKRPVEQTRGEVPLFG